MSGSKNVRGWQIPDLSSDKSRICQIPDLSSWICGFVKNYRRYQKGVFRVSCSLYIIICSLKGEKCSCNTWAQAQDRASGPCLQHFKIPASLTSTFTSQTWTQSKHLDIRAHSKHHRRPSLHPQTTWFHANHKMQVGGTACHTTQLAPQPRGKNISLLNQRNLGENWAQVLQCWMPSGCTVVIKTDLWS